MTRSAVGADFVQCSETGEARDPVLPAPTIDYERWGYWVPARAPPDQVRGRLAGMTFDMLAPMGLFRLGLTGNRASRQTSPERMARSARFLCEFPHRRRAVDDRHEWQRRADQQENIVWGLIGGAAVLLLVWAVSFHPASNQQVATNDPPAAARTAPAPSR